jgi:hypothetical protein
MAEKKDAKVEQHHIDLTKELTDEQKALIAGSEHIQDLMREVLRLQTEHDRIDAELESAEARLDNAIEATTVANAPPPEPPAGARQKDDKAESKNDKDAKSHARA